MYCRMSCTVEPFSSLIVPVAWIDRSRAILFIHVQVCHSDTPISSNEGTVSKEYHVFGEISARYEEKLRKKCRLGRAKKQIVVVSSHKTWLWPDSNIVCHVDSYISGTRESSVQVCRIFFGFCVGQNCIKRIGLHCGAVLDTLCHQSTRCHIALFVRFSCRLPRYSWSHTHVCSSRTEKATPTEKSGEGAEINVPGNRYVDMPNLALVPYSWPQNVTHPRKMSPIPNSSVYPVVYQSNV